jgi:hypothetical protein
MHEEDAMEKRRILAAIALVVSASLACNLGAPGPATETPEEEPTQTAPATETLVAESPTAATPTEAVTGTPTVPMASVSVATNCRSGPSTAYEILWSLLPGQFAEVVGKNASLNYWIVKYAGGTCWLWGQYATIAGNTSGLPEWPVPATPTPSVPAAPTNFDVDFDCTLQGGLGSLYDVHVEMTWADAASNEDGYRVFRDDTLLVTLAADQTSYSDDTTQYSVKIITDPIPTITYAVQAFNDTGESAKKSKTISCWN